MPAIPQRPSQPSLYPDWSTLVYAFQGLPLDADPEKRALLTLVHDVSTRANLCLSLGHVLELLRGGDAIECHERAVWLDSLDVVWLLDHDEVLEWELKRLLRSHFLGEVLPRELPATSTFLATFRGWTPKGLADVLRDSRIARLVDAVVKSPRIQQQLEEFAVLGLRTNQRLFVDRQQHEPRVGATALHAQLEANADRALLDEAFRINKHLADSDPSYRIQRGLLWVAPSEEEVRAVIRPLEEMRHEIPASFVFHRMMRRVGDVVGRKAGLESKFFKSQDRLSDAFDWQHLLGAAYCDVFTCDARTSACLEDTRTLLGRTKEVVYRGDLGAFVCSIRAGLGL